MYQERFYREFHQNNHLLKIQVTIEETDILVIIDPVDSEEILFNKINDMIIQLRQEIKECIRLHPEFLSSLIPLRLKDQSKLIQHMIDMSTLAGVGPMATVAGITSETIGRNLIGEYGNINLLIENGGDIFLNTLTERNIAIYAGENPFSNLLKIRIQPSLSPLGICTSAGTLGHSLSFGKADALVVLAKDTALADGFATGLGNMVQTAADIQAVIEIAKSHKDILGMIVVVDQQLGAYGEIEFI